MERTADNTEDNEPIVRQRNTEKFEGEKFVYRMNTEKFEGEKFVYPMNALLIF